MKITMKYDKHGLEAALIQAEKARKVTIYVM